MQDKVLTTLGIRSVLPPLDLSTPHVLHEAAQRGEVATILELIRRGVPIDEKSDSGWTALQVASAHGQVAAVEILLDNGADTEALRDKGLTALHMSASNGKSEVVDVLLKRGANPDARTNGDDYTALHLAALRGRKRVLKSLIENRVDLEARSSCSFTALHLASMQGHAECVAELISADANIDARADTEETPLLMAAFFGRQLAANTLLKFGADIDAIQRDGRTAAMAASYLGKTNVLRVLISGGANLDIVDHEGYTALRCAIESGHVAAATLLLKERVRVNTAYTDHQETALHLAVRMNQPAVITALLEKGADIEACDADGDPPLEWAVETGCLELVKLLLEHGAQINRRNPSTGETVLLWAVRSGHVDVTQLLLARGADPAAIDLQSLQKKQVVDDDDFETCKILIETAIMAGESSQSPPPEPRSQPPPTRLNTFGRAPGGSTEGKKSEVDEVSRIINPIYNIEAQSTSESFIARFQDRIEHKGVKCDGPHCEEASGYICGVRFKCVACENTDLCSTCITSFFNNHDHRHPMVRCLLPTNCQIIRDIDKNTKQNWLQSNPRLSGGVEDLSHAVYAETDQRALLQLQGGLSHELGLDWSEARRLVTVPDPSVFAIFRSCSREGSPTRKEIIRDIAPEPNSLAMYKIDDAGNVRLRNFQIGKKSAVKDTDGLIHHQDAMLLTNVMVGRLTGYDYTLNNTFRKWAWEGRMVTRVITLKPGEFSDKLVIELETVDLGENPTYEALSYTWKETAYERAHMKNMGPEEDKTLRSIATYKHAIYCRDGSGKEAFLSVSCGLRDALRRLRDPVETKYLWIDQLSINQQSLQERAFQVARMMYCYNRAKRVVLWTGDEDQHTKDVFDMYRAIARFCQVHHSYPTPNQFLEKSSGFETPVWEAAKEFFHRPVFSRSWVIQEIVVGQLVTVRCGDYEIAWSDLAIAASAFASRLWVQEFYVAPIVHGLTTSQNKLMAWSEFDWKDELFGHLFEVIAINKLRTNFQTCRETSVEELLFTTCQFEASEARDHIYSLLSIRSAKITPARDNDLEPDYKKSDVDVFIEATRFCMLQSSSLSICGLNDTVSSKKIEGLPTWVPDFSSTTISAQLSYNRPRHPQPYNASADVPFTAMWPYEDRPDLLVTSSCKIETVTAVSEHALDDPKLLPLIVAEWSKMASRNPYYPTGEFAADVFITTCIANGGSSVNPSTPLYQSTSLMLGRFFLQHLHALQGENGPAPLQAINPIISTIMKETMEKFPTALFGDGQQQQEPPTAATTAGAGGAGPSDPAQDNAATAAAAESIIAACRNRVFLSTHTGHFGLGPRDARVGDEIHVLAGTRVPFVLRRITSPDTEAGAGAAADIDRIQNDGLPLYGLVGECFVHGAMRGERAREGWEWEGICLR